MMNERRVYTRVKIDRTCNIHPTVLDTEYVAKVYDVSEGGLCFYINAPEYQFIPVGTCIRFVLVDEFSYLNDVKTAVLSGIATVVRVDGQYFGCKLLGMNKAYRKYIRHRKGHRLGFFDR